MKVGKTRRRTPRSRKAALFHTSGGRESFALPPGTCKADISTQYLAEALRVFRWQRKLGDGALAQLDQGDLFRTLDPESNPVAVLVKHMTGNMRSRWTDFLTTDGEKPNRHRDQEFLLDASTKRADVLRWWEEGWALVFNALEPRRAEDVMRTVLIRGEPHTVLQAIQRQLDHYGYHVGQIVFLAKHLKSAQWKTLSVPRGQSQAFNTGDPEKRKYLK